MLSKNIEELVHFLILIYLQKAKHTIVTVELSMFASFMAVVLPISQMLQLFCPAGLPKLPPAAVRTSSASIGQIMEAVYGIPY